jgi:hypothetical protein
LWTIIGPPEVVRSSSFLTRPDGLGLQKYVFGVPTDALTLFKGIATCT